MDIIQNHMDIWIRIYVDENMIMFLAIDFVSMWNMNMFI